MRQEAEHIIHAPSPMLRARFAGTAATPMNPKNNRLKKKPPVFTGPRERFGQMLVRIRQLEGNPHYIAMGLGLGIFVSITPIIPLQTLVAIALAYLFRGSKSAAALGTWLSNPLTIPLVYYANYKLGCLLLGYQTTLDSISFDSFSQLMALGIDVTWAMLVGGVVIGAVLGILAYFITFRIFVTIRRNTQPVDPESGMAA
ncbi:hypothetical protein DSCOOX_41000 [Desulfosarcina ovata subsp. ovata]|uniref:DUF2062 domain-containing protein n=2 Tax=Desulfosarcina ovata TaxID=83564 RepID=A0A5K8AGD9_9BACT|nr:hypothetical protein DSCOOX_41000 [Desulfosarcina ovata subsp. ovata]